MPIGNVARWPRNIRRSVEAIAAVLVNSCALALDRMTGSSNWYLKVVAAECAKDILIARLQRQVGLLQRRMRRMPERERPHYAPEERLEILQFHWLHGFSLEELSDQFVVSSSTLSRWLKAWNVQQNPGLFFGRVAWNKYADAVHALIADFRTLFPDPMTGTRSIAAWIRKAGIALSRSTVQRTLKKPPKPKATRKSTGPGEPSGDRILAPTLPNCTWHLDLTSLRILWIHFTIGAVLDGYSRKLLELKLFLSCPTTHDMTRWLKNVISVHGRPRFLVTDRGGQFKKRFRNTLKSWGIEPVQGRKRSCCFNGKVERFFRTLKAWQRLALLFCSASRLQTRLDRFRRYYNTERPSLPIAGNTPESAWSRKRSIDCRRFFAADPIQPTFRIQRVGFESDSTLPVARITTELQFKRIA